MTEFNITLEDGILVWVSDREIQLIWSLLFDAIEDGGYPERVREYLKLFDKFERMRKIE